MGDISANDSLYAQAICPQTLIDLMPSANAYLARLTDLATGFKPPELLPGTDFARWVDDMVAYFCDFDVHPALSTIQ